jgi:hypothetical protein
MASTTPDDAFTFEPSNPAVLARDPDVGAGVGFCVTRGADAAAADDVLLVLGSGSGRMASNSASW